MNLNNLQSKIKDTLKEVQNKLTSNDLIEGKQFFEQDNCIILSQSEEQFNFIMESDNLEITLCIDSEAIYDEENDTDIECIYSIMPATEEWDKHSYACLLKMQQFLELETHGFIEHKKYTREGMIRRVLDERRQKALHANYRIKWANNIYGDHILTNENGVKYKIFLRDFENETGYSNSKDSEVNKLGTTKHIMFAFEQIKNNKNLYKRLRKTCPFVEVYCDPLSNYAVRWFYSHEVPTEIQDLLNQYFTQEGFVNEDRLADLSKFFEEAQYFENIVIRPEVHEKVNSYLEDKALASLQKKYEPDYSSINATLYDYQKDGINFTACRKHAIIADEMGLGKTIQAIGTAVVKIDLFGFKKTLVVCPASLKEQWKKEIEKFTDLTAEVVQGTPDERAVRYIESDAYFLIVNYETVLRDQIALNKANIDFLILDEAQKVKNYATKSASAIKNVGRKHVLIITGTPIENKLIDLFSLMSILDPHLLGPLWEFSYQHCLFDNHKPNKINAYYNLSKLKEELNGVLLRREKRKVIEQLPNIQQQDIPVKMTPLQADFHASYASGIGQIVRKKYLTPYDMQRLQQLLTGMRMTCNSTYLVDESTNDSPKLEELRYVLMDKLDLRNQTRKVIIFSEWVKMHKLIGQMLLQNGIGFSELNGSVPVKKRGDLIKTFEEDDNCKVFLSTEAGGAGLNLQVADVLFNFELPWNPAKKNQRIGRIDRLGQKSNKLTVYNFITANSIEQRIALGLMVKQNLFDSVLNEGDTNDFVDFTNKGKGQFLQQIKEMAGEFEDQDVVEKETVEETELIVQELKEYTRDDFIKDHANDYVVPFEEDEPPVQQLIDFEENPDANNKQPDSEGNVREETEVVSSENIKVNEPDKPIKEESKVTEEPKESQEQTVQAEKMEKVLNNGMQFLSGLMQMATGKDVGIEDQKIEVNKETGEVTMKFKLPGL